MHARESWYTDSLSFDFYISLKIYLKVNYTKKLSGWRKWDFIRWYVIFWKLFSFSGCGQQSFEQLESYLDKRDKKGKKI